MATQIELFLDKQLKEGKLSEERFNSLMLMHSGISQGQREYLDNNFSLFKNINKLEMFLKVNTVKVNLVEVQEKLDTKSLDNITHSTKVARKSYEALEGAISILKVIFWLFLLASILVGGVATNFNFVFWISLIPISLLAILIYAQIQMLEAFKDTAENTNITNLLLKELIDKKK